MQIPRQTSTKYQNIEETLKAMLEPLKNDQIFLRYLLYPSRYPLELEVYDEVTSDPKGQPDIEMPYDLIGNEDVILTLFNPTIAVLSKTRMYFSHLDFRASANSQILTEHRYSLDIVIPLNEIQMGDKLRNVRIGDEIMKCIDNQNIPVSKNMGKIFISNGQDYILDSNYQGMRFIITVSNVRMEI